MSPSAGWRFSWRSVVGSWHIALLLYLLLFTITPFDLAYPGSGLDPSWQTALNEAVVRHLTFGREVLFTSGPYAVVITGEYHPQLPWLGIGGGLLLTTGYAVAVMILLARRRRWVAVALSIGLALGVASTDALCLLFPMVAALATHRMVTTEDREPRAWGDRALVSLMAAPLGLLPLVKLSSAPAVLAGMLAASLLLILHGRRVEAAIFWGVPALSTPLLWLAAGQPLDALGDYVFNSLTTVSGYTQAMSLAGNVAQAQLVVVLSVVVVVALLASSRLPLRERALVAMVVAATLFVAFKAAMVRLDTHALLMVAPLLVTTLLAASYCRGWPVRGALVLLCLGVAVPLRISWLSDLDPTPAESIRHALTAGPVGLGQRIFDRSLLDRRYDEARSEIRDEDLVPRVHAGTNVDLYPFDLSGLLAQDVDWNPRPVFQSYVSYTPALAKRNADHLRGDSAPDTVLFGIEAIDDRLPALEDGASWLPLLEDYRIDSYDAIHDYLVMQRRERSVPIPVSTRPIRVPGVLGRPVVLPSRPGAASQGWLAEFDVEATLKGRLSEIVWKPAEMRITVALEDGRTQHYRFIPRMGRARFLLSPLVLNPRNMAGLVLPDGSTGAARPPTVRQVRLDARGADGMWKRTYSITLTAVRLPVTTGTG